MLFKKYIDQTVQCSICNKETNISLCNKLRRGFGVVYFCEHCDIGFLVRENFDIKSFYRNQYRESASHHAQPKKTNAKEIFENNRLFQKERLDLIRPYVFAESKVLEIGASSGQFVSHIIDDCSRIAAIELDIDCVKFLNENFSIETDSEFFEDSKFSDDEFDIVCSFQVLEHTLNPIDFMKTIFKATKVGGRAFIELPNLKDPLLQLWDVPAYQSFYYHAEHLFYFTENSLKKVCEMAGFDPIKMKVHFSQDYNLLNHIHWIMNNAPQETNKIGLSEINLKHISGNELSFWLNDKLKELNKEYINKLKDLGMTSNLMIELEK
tara:strand:+ start:2529 stop:3497 length:969 start_codon:yes stop_codon:yes gene_type:complete